MIGLQPAQRFIDLFRGRFFRATVDLGHQESAVAARVLFERLAHPHLAFAPVIIPGVIEKVDAPIKARVDQLYGVVLRQIRFSQMKAAHTDTRNLFAGVSERTIRNVLR